jgi:hypothetical protein
VRRVDGVDGFRMYARPGDAFPADVMTRHVDLLWGHGDDHTAMTAILAEALSHLSYEFRFAAGHRRVAAGRWLDPGRGRHPDLAS